MTDRLPTLTHSAPRRALWVLAALVSLVHWWVLADGPLDLGLNNTPPTRPPANLVFNTRRIEVPPLPPANQRRGLYSRRA